MYEKTRMFLYLYIEYRFIGVFFFISLDVSSEVMVNGKKGFWFMAVSSPRIFLSFTGIEYLHLWSNRKDIHYMFWRWSASTWDKVTWSGSQSLLRKEETDRVSISLLCPYQRWRAPWSVSFCAGFVIACPSRSMRLVRQTCVYYFW